MRVVSSFFRVFSNLTGKFRWHLNEWMLSRLWILNLFGSEFTVIDAFGTPGDTLMAGTVCRHLKERYPRLRVNCITPNPEILSLDPAISGLNGTETFFSVRFWYLDLLTAKDAITNVLRPTLSRLGFDFYEYRSRVYLSDEEVRRARKLVADLKRPIISINVVSREAVKTWPIGHWRELVSELVEEATVLQLGDAKEPEMPGVVRWAGKLSMRDSMALLAQADVHVGPDSFLMHAANGVGVPSVAILGGSRTDRNVGYAENRNLYMKIECSPCWIHTSAGQECIYGVKCMQLITPQAVSEQIRALLYRRREPVGAQSGGMR